MFTKKFLIRVAALIFVSLWPVAGITARGASATVVAGRAFSLAPSVSGTAPFTYQWFKDGVAMSGVTASSYQVSNMQSANAGVYSVAISNSAGSTTSDNATIVLATSPVFSMQPSSQTVTAGGTVIFTAAAGGLPAPAFQWKLNGVALVGATNAALTIANAQPANAGAYSVVATNSAGSVTSSSAALTVSAGAVVPAFTTQPVSQTVAVGSAVTFTALASGSPAPVYQWRKNGVNLAGATGSAYLIASATSADAGTFTVVATNSAGSATSASATLTVSPAAIAPVFTTQPLSQTVIVGNTATLIVAASGSPVPTYQWRYNGAVIAGLTGSSLVITNTQLDHAGTFTVVATNSAGSVVSTSATLTVIAAATVPAFTSQPASQTVNAGTAVTLTAAASGFPTPTYQWRKNGANISGATGATYAMTNVTSANAGTYSVVATNSAGSATSVGAVLTVNAANSAPVIITPPASQTVTAGSAVTFTVAVSGSPSPTLQWKRNGTNISGATGGTLALTNVQSASAGTYTVVASNVAGSVTSPGAVLTVNPAASAPVITMQPLSQTVVAGSAITFTAAASGVPTPTYQWRKNGAAVSGATVSSYVLASASSADAGTYTVVATNSAGSVTSSSATLTVNTVPTITTQPVSQTVTTGVSVNFIVVANGAPAPTFQWRLNGIAIAGATNATLALTSAQSANAGTYTVVATNSAGSVTSSSAVLTVNTAPVITTQPASQTVTAGTSVTFTVAAGGSPTPTYQWRKNGVAISGATGTAYTKANTASGDAGTYSVIVTNSVGSATSTGATLTVNPATNPPTITTQPLSQTAAAGTNVTFSVVASGAPSLKYQWKKNGSSIWRATGTSYALTNLSSSSAGTYTVVVSNSYGSVTSVAAVLSLGTAPAITSQPVSRTATVGASVTFSVVASGSPAPTFQWKRNGANLAGATDATLTLAGIQSTDAGTYTVVASNSIGSVTSTSATLTVNTAAISPVVYRVDFNGDGKSDVLWQNGTTGACSVWLMNGTTVGSVTALGAVPANQKIAGTGDFNGDGQADILWQNSVTGECRLWLMAGTNKVSDLSLNASSLDWQMRGTGDFNGDGKSDIVWQNEVTGECGVWLMNGTTSTSIVGLGLWSPDVMITGFGDFNQDGQSDILWQNTMTGAYGVWLMTGTTVANTVTLGTQSLDWQMSGAGDFNGDTRSDILWQNLLTGECRVWLMNGMTVGSNVTLGSVQLDWVLRN